MHNWLFVEALDPIGRVSSLVAIRVCEQGSRVPHSAIQGQSLDEVYFDARHHVRDTIAPRRGDAREARLAENSAPRCVVCTTRRFNHREDHAHDHSRPPDTAAEDSRPPTMPLRWPARIHRAARYRALASRRIRCVSRIVLAELG